MPDIDGVNANPVVASPASPPGDAPKNEPVSTPTPAVAQNTDGNVPFNQNPAIMDFVERQKEKARAEERERMKATLQFQQPQTPKPDPIQQIESELDEKVKTGTLTPRDIIQAQRKITEIVTEQHYAPIKKQVGMYDIQRQIDAFHATHPDYPQLQAKMAEVLNSLPEATRQFYANDPAGIEYCYLKAKQLTPSVVQTQIPGSGASIQNRGGVRVVDTGNDAVSKASQALIGKDKKTYEEQVRRLQNR